MSGEMVLTLAVAIIGSGGFSAIVNAWLERRKEERKKKEDPDPVALGVRMLLQDRIEGLSIKYIKAGEVREENRRFLHNAFDVYHDKLKGNGDLNELMERVDELPIIYPDKR